MFVKHVNSVEIWLALNLHLVAVDGGLQEQLLACRGRNLQGCAWRSWIKNSAEDLGDQHGDGVAENLPIRGAVGFKHAQGVRQGIESGVSCQAGPSLQVRCPLRLSFTARDQGPILIRNYEVGLLEHLAVFAAARGKQLQREGNVAVHVSNFARLEAALRQEDLQPLKAAREELFTSRKIVPKRALNLCDVREVLHFLTLGRLELDVDFIFALADVVVVRFEVDVHLLLELRYHFHERVLEARKVELAHRPV